MIIWINGPFGAGKTTLAKRLRDRRSKSLIFDPEEIGFVVKETVPMPASGDYQDLPLWRGLTIAAVREIRRNYSQDIIIPVFGIFATLAEFERDLIRERTMAGLASARARGRKGGRKFALTKAQVRLAQAAMAQRDTSVSDLCKELGIERVTLYRYVGPKGELRDHGKHVLGLT